MTVTLMGRWTTRLLLMSTIGVVITMPLCLLMLSVAPMFVLGLVLVVGLMMDVLYDRRQRRRWDHDWPVYRQVADGLLEGCLSGMVIITCCCGGLVFGQHALLLVALVFPFHYAAVWLGIFLTMQGPLRVFFPYARFRGGRVP